MADMLMVVDAALAEVPVNLMPLLDSTDFVSREVAIAYNQAGMDLVWNFVTTAGAYTQTAVTPTTAGTYDWAHQGDGMYSIEIPASGGASINNDTEGYGWFTGFCTGVLPWRGPVIQFSPANVVDALVNGSDKLQVHADEITAGLITAAAIAADAITDAKVAADVTIASVTGSVGSVAAGVTVTTNNDKTGYGLSAAAVQAVWDALTSALTTVGSIGKLLVDNVNATISSRLASASYTAPPTVGQIADQVWEETLADHSGTAGSTAAALNAAGSAGDPWSTALPGAYGSGTAGKIIGDNINATVSSRATPAQVATELGTYDAPTNAEMVARTLAAADYATATALATADAVADAIKLKTDNLPASPAATSDIPTADQNADALLARNVNGGSSTGRTVKQAMKRLRNKVAAPGGAMTVYDEDDTTPNWTATLTTTAGDPVSELDPS